MHRVGRSSNEGATARFNAEDDEEETIYSVRVFRKVFWPLAEIPDIRALASV